jgi:RNA polymerase sigma factor (sigma-70 family)
MRAMQGTDSELVAESLAGRRDAFRQIVERYQTLICSLAYSATGSLGRSEDLAQETFVTAWKQLAELREPSKLRPWLCTIVRFLVGKELRRLGREPTHAAEPLEAMGEVAAPEPLPPEQVISQEETAILWRSLEGIPQVYREPSVLFYREQQSVEKVAAELELTEDAVKQRLSRGRNLLRDQMLAYVEGALAKTSPGKAFTVGVVAALPLLATSAKAVTAGAAIKGASTGKAATGLGTLVEAILMTSTTKIIIAAIVVVAAVATFLVVQNQAPVVSQNPAGAATQTSQAPAPEGLSSIHMQRCRQRRL